MPKAFPYIEGQTYLISRSLKEKFWFLRPDPLVTRVVTFLVAEAMAYARVAIHTLCVSCDGMRLVATDPEQNLPKFMEWLDREIANALKAIYHIDENAWAPGSYKKKVLKTPGETLTAMAEVLCDPVRMGLVDVSRRWPGLRLGPFTQPRTVTRPPLERLEERDATLPLVLTPPPALADLDPRELLGRLNAAIYLQETEDRAKRSLKPSGFIGLERVLASPVWTQTAPADVPKDPVAVQRSLEAEVLALAEVRRWHRAYYAVRWKFARGEHDVVFPYGTYWLKHYAGAHVAPRIC